MQNFLGYGNADLVFSFHSQVLFLITGVCVSILMSSLSIYHSKRPFFPNIYYPPITFSVCLVTLYWCLKVLLSDFIVLEQLWGLFIGLAFTPLFHTCLLKSKSQSNKTVAASDKPKNHLNELDAEPKHCAISLLNKLDEGKKHIALCGAYGTGKSSVINSVMNEIKSKDANTIHCNVDLWGVNPNSIISFVLEEITSECSAHMDVSTLKQLPSRYVDAIRTSNSSFSFLSSLLYNYHSPDILLRRYDALLRATKKTLVVTIQDIDRNIDTSSSMAELASLLDRLKDQCERIVYIFAVENTPILSQTIRRICTERIDLVQPSLVDNINVLQQKLEQSLPENYLSYLNSSKVNVGSFDAKLVESILPSYRQYNELEKSVIDSWKGVSGNTGLMGEVYPSELIMMNLLKLGHPKSYEIIVNIQQNSQINTFEKIVKYYLYNSSDTEKEFVFKTLLFFGYIISYDLNLSNTERFSREFLTSLEEDSRVSENFINAARKDALSLLNSDRKKLVQRGGKIVEDFSYFNAYTLFKDIANGNLSLIVDFITKTSVKKNQQYWLSSLSIFGIPLFLESNESDKLARELLKNFIGLRNLALSHELLYTIEIGLRETKLSLKKSNFVKYFSSKKILIDIKNWMNDLRASTLGDIVLIIYRCRFIEDIGQNADNIIRSLILDIVNAESDTGFVLIISLLHEANGRPNNPVFNALYDTLKSDDLLILKSLLNNKKSQGSELNSTYRTLYSGSNFATEEKLSEAYAAAKKCVEKLLERDVFDMIESAITIGETENKP